MNITKYRKEKSMDWEEAVKLAKEGDDRGYEYLYNQTYRKNYYIALRYMENEQDAIDVLQESYIKAFNKIEQLREADKFSSWMSQIVAHMALDVKNSNKRKPSEKLFSEMEPSDDDDMSFEEIIEDNKIENRPELAIDQKETGRLVNEIIATLSEEQKICVIMYYINGMSVKDIAETVGVSDNTIKSRLNYARKKIEGKVLELEKRGTKLYGIAPVPFFIYLLLKDAKSVQASPLDVKDIVKQLDAVTERSGAKAAGEIVEDMVDKTTSKTVGDVAGRTAGKAAAFSVKKAVIGIVAGIAVVGGAVYATNALNNTDNLTQQVEESEGNEQDNSAIQDSTEATIDVDAVWKKAYKEYVESGLKEEQIPEGSGYAVMDAGYQYPTLIIAPGVFNEDANSSGSNEQPLFTVDLDYLKESLNTAPKMTYVKMLSDDQCVCQGNHDLWMYTTSKDGEVSRLDAEPYDSKGYPVMIYNYMNLGAFNLTYLPDEKLLVGNLNGSGSGRGVATYYVDNNTNKLEQGSVYSGDAMYTVEDKYIVYFSSIEEAFNNRNSVSDIEDYMR